MARRAVRCAVVAVLVGGSLAWLPAAARADASYDGQAKADGVDITVYNPSLPLGLTVEGAGPTASSHLNTVGVSDAFAAFPYPGDTVAGLPGLAGALFGNIPTPSYPFIVSTGLGDQPKDQDLGPVTLHAESGVQENAASATAGTGTTGNQSTSRVEQLEDGSVQATANTDLNALKLADQLTVSGVQAHTEVDADASTGAVTRTSTLSIGRIEIPGLALPLPATTPSTIPVPQPIGALPQLPPIAGLPELPVPFGGTTLSDPDIGFENGQFTVTLPANGGTKMFAVPAQPVLDAFKALGVTMTYQQAQNTDTGITGATFTIDTEVPAPPNNQLYNGPTDVGYVLGRSNANVDLSPDLSSYSDPSLGDTSTFPSTPVTSDSTPSTGPSTSASGSSPVASSAAPTGGAATSGSSGDSGSAAGGLLAGGASSAGTGSLGALMGSTDPITSSAATSPSVASVGSSIPEGTTLAAHVTDAHPLLAGNIYLVFVSIAGLAFVAATGLRILGVRLLWRS